MSSDLISMIIVLVSALVTVLNIYVPVVLSGIVFVLTVAAYIVSANHS